MIVGFTGTQRGLTLPQSNGLTKFFNALRISEFHHGDCIGADKIAHTLAVERGIRIIIHPPVNKTKRAFCASEHTLEPKEYLCRNRDIVNASDMLLACPGEDSEVLRSGTWSTIRYARRTNINGKIRPILIIYPSGKMITENKRPS